MSLNATLFGMAIWFILLIWFAKAKIWPPLVAAMDERSRKIAAGLAEAEKGKSALAEGEKQKAVMLKEARDQASDMKALNDKQIATSIEEAKSQARMEAERIIVAAEAQIQMEMQKAREQLREQVAVLAVAGAEKILKREVDAKAHAEMLAQLKAQL
ncbi:MAG: F0F1 ATP synthase subunit B [Betaproteobacteria bacterium]